MNQPIHAVLQGQGAAKLVLIHGNMASARWWQPVMEKLADDCTMLAVNLRGFGDSPATPAEVTLASHSKDIYELIAAHNFAPCVAVGHSLGGAVAMQLAADYPELLAGLVLVDSAPVGGMQGIDYNLLQMVISNKEIAMASLKATLAKAIDEAYLNQLMEDGVRALAAVLPNTRALDGADFTGRAPAFHKPVLVVQGELDALVPMAEAEKTAQTYPKAVLKTIPGAGHNPQVEDPAAFVAVLREFLKTL